MIGVFWDCVVELNRLFLQKGGYSLVAASDKSSFYLAAAYVISSAING
jgi:hypothetical protein